ncbi:hypothetical protein [Deinococcus frigens]|uniref:hypothetical protein n=1 Tax=Deinococcus frigens TaxID=249403 RepID=UPI000496BE4E|nr:hypothetical protein [Deinococcus frigens]
MSDTLNALMAQNTRTVYLLADADGVSAHPVKAGTTGALRFVLARVAADRIRANLLFAALGKDAYVQYAAWYNQQARAALEQAEINSVKAGDPELFDDTLPDDAEWRAYSVALEDASEQAVLEVGLLEPLYVDAAKFLGPYQTALVREIVQWDREAPAEKHP